MSGPHNHLGSIWSPTSQTSFLVGNFFAVSYSKPALEFIKISFKYSSNDHHSMRVDDSVADNHLPTTVLKLLFDYDYLLLVVGPLGCCTLIFLCSLVVIALVIPNLFNLSLNVLQHQTILSK